MDRVSADIRQGVNKRFINAICNHNNELVLEYLKNGMSVTKECMGKEPMFYAVTHNNFGAILLLLKYGAILDKNYLALKRIYIILFYQTYIFKSVKNSLF
ncbi:hypothetical protein ACJ5FG_001118 [Campylobacter coli]